MKSLVCLLMMSVCWACAAPLTPVKVHSNAATSARVVLLSSGNNRISKAVTESFERNINANVAEFLLGAEVPKEALEKGIRAYQPAVIVALGGHAVQFARTRCQDIPMLVGLVIRNQVHESSNFTPVGVALETSVATEFSLYRAVLPQLHQILTFYHPEHSSAFIQQATADLKSLNIKLMAVPATSAAEMFTKYASAAGQNQALWMANDPVLLNADSFKALRAAADEAHQPLLCSALREYAAAGATMVVDIDFSNVGAQLAEMAERIIAGTPPYEIGLRAPIGGKLIINMKSAAALGVDVPLRVKSLISEVIDE